jgi:hypothetical protein
LVKNTTGFATEDNYLEDKKLVKIIDNDTGNKKRFERVY